MEPERTYYDDGSIQDERWIVNNELHRLDGPAIIWYYKDGSIGHEYWWINDIYINDDIFSWLKENNITAPFTEIDQMAIKLRWG